MSTTTRRRPGRASTSGGGLPARRAMARWAWRLFMRERRQQLLLTGLVAAAVAATILGAAIASAAPSSQAAMFGSASAQLTTSGHNPQLSADIAVLKRQFGPVDVIVAKTVVGTGTVASIELRAQDPHGRFSAPMLQLTSGQWPSGPGQAALSAGVASLFNLHPGGLWRADGRIWQITGMARNPANLGDDFALVAPGQLTSPDRVTVLFDASPAAVAGLHLPGGATAQTRRPQGASPAGWFVLALAVLGLIFIGLVASAGFTVMAQRRLRALGMLASAGATARNLRQVMIASGVFTGTTGSLAGAALGFAAWAGYRPHLQDAVGHVIDLFDLPWTVIGFAIVLAVATAVLAAWRPARAVSRISVARALSGRPAPPRRPHRAAAAGAILLAAGLVLLAGTGGMHMAGHSSSLKLAAGVPATAAGFLLLSPLAITLPAALARHTPVTVRLALRDLGRYRARSGAAVAAAAFAVFLAMITTVVATARYTNPLTYQGQNLAANQLIIYQPHGPGSGYSGLGPPLTAARQHTFDTRVRAFATSVHASSALHLYAAGRLGEPDTITVNVNSRATLWQATSSRTLGRSDAGKKDSVNFQGTVYVATPALLHTFGIGPGQVRPQTDVLTARAGLGSVPDLRLLGPGSVTSHYTTWGHLLSERYSCAPGRCIKNPVIQETSALPAGASAPNTIITEHAMHALGLQLIPQGWLIQLPGPFTPAQQNAARGLALITQSFVETRSAAPGLSQITGAATATAIMLALGVAAMTAALLRAETANGLRTLVAAGADSKARRALTASTAGTLGLLGALLGTTAAYLAVMAWAHGSLSQTLGNVPAADLAAVLAGLPVTAWAGGWLLGGRQPTGLARRPLE